MELLLIILIIWIHFVSDFLLQTDYMAINKSTNNQVLLLHCGVYSIPFLIFGLDYALLAGMLHFIVDFITARMTTYFWSKEQRHWFFVTIGCDQAIHMTCLILTMKYIRLMF